MLTTTTWVTAWAGSAAIVALGVRHVRQTMSDSRLVLMAVLAALVFALQMLNFPVAGGTSGHFSGGAAAAIILGPWPAVLVMTAVLVIQSLFFADGGVTALGANIVTMGVIGPFAGWWLYTLVTRGAASPARKAAAAFAAAWTGVFAAALAAAAMLWLSGRVPLAAGLGAMGFWHALIGVGEGFITAGLVSYLLGVRPDLLAGRRRREAAGTRGVAIALGVVALAAAGLSFLASSLPDGLEFVYFEQRLGAAFSETAPVRIPMADYLLPGVANETLAGILAGVVGLVLTGVLLYVAVKAAHRRPGTGA